MKNVLLIGGEGYIGNIVAQNLMSNGSIVTSGGLGVAQDTHMYGKLNVNGV